MTRHTQLRKLFAEGFSTIGTYDPFTARIAENAGCPATYIGSFSFELAGIGAPDIGLMTLTELAMVVSRITEVTNSPIMCDVDTGFGDLNNIWRTVRTLESAGASAVQIEDQTFPKVCPILPGKKLVPIDKAVARIKTAVDARRDDEFMIIARADADVVSIDELITRSNAYLAAGADAALPMLLTYEGRPATEAAPEDLTKAYRRLIEEINGPVIILDTVPGLNASDMLNLGAKMVLFPTSLIEASFEATSQSIKSTLETGRWETYFEQRSIVSNRMDLMNAVGVKDFLKRSTG